MIAAVKAFLAVLAYLHAAHPWAPPPPLGGKWLELRMCESGDRYDIRSPGEPNGGGYQFDPRTWDANVDAVTLRSYPTAADAPYWVQDWEAFHLWLARGRYPWPHCGLVAGL